MSHPVLRLFDGFDHTSPDLKEEVRKLQRELRSEGFIIDVDGQFGRDTEDSVKRFQRDQGLDDDGIVGARTWAALLRTPPPKAGFLFPTTFGSTNTSLLNQLSEASKYRSIIDAASREFDIPVPLLAGIGSRESRWGLALTPAGPTGTGDAVSRRFPTRFRIGSMPPDGGGFGRGLMQIDFDAHEFARTGNWKDPEANIRYGTQVLAGNRSFFVRREPSMEGMNLFRAAVAGYNCGVGNVLRALRDGRDVDFYTAGRDYSTDVLNRAGWFQNQGWI
jgi:hypothetical protein